MLFRMLFTIATAACLFGLYAVYAVIVRPLVVVSELPPSLEEPVKRAIAHRPAENVRVAETYLSELKWAAKSQYTLRSGQAFIYTNGWFHDGDSPWVRFDPFAMVWLQKDSQGREIAISLVSDSAQVKFASSFNTINPNPGRVVMAVLDGTVQVRGPDGLAIVGKQFTFDESAPSLVSTYPVQFEYGMHSGEGRSLNVKLILAEGPPGNARPHVYGIRTVRLNGGADPNSKKFMHAKLDLRFPQNGQTKLVHVKCRRDLEVDIPNHSILFSEEVRAHSPVSKTDYDQLECDELLMEFSASGPPDRTRKQPEEGPRLTAADASQGSNLQQLPSDMEFKRMTASGQRVKLASTQNQLRATMKRLVYDADRRRIQMTDPKDGVLILQKQSTLHVPEVEMFLREDNSPQEVWCRGKGSLQMNSEESNEAAFTASWASALRKSTDSETGLDLIELQQKAKFLQRSQNSALGAELIRVWLDPIVLNVSSASNDAGKMRPAEPKPRRLVAERDVAFFSPRLRVRKTNQLVVHFEDSAKPRELGLQSRSGLQQVSLRDEMEPGASPPHPANAAARTRTGSQNATPAVSVRQSTLTSVSQAERGSLGPPIDIPASGNPERQRGTANMTGDAAEPLEVTADHIGVRMQTIDERTQPELVEVETQGHVKIIRRGGAGEAPMTATGDRLHLQNRGPYRETVHLIGNPAHLRDRGLHVEGRDVNLDRGTNRVWVKGKGLLQLPVPPGTSIASLGQSTADPDLDVWWDESMEFDGRTAKFVGKVLAELGRSKMWCEQMDVDLASPISFSEPAPDARPGLKSIHCCENVSFQSSHGEENRLDYILRGRVADFTHDHLRGTSNAQGPGQIQFWRRSEKGQGGSQRQQSQANRPGNAVTSEWDFTRINFKGRMTGNLVMYVDGGNVNRQTSHFYNSVTIVHGPVNRPSDMIDADHLTADAGSMRCEELEFAHHAKGPANSQAYQEMVGKGNAQIEGRGFYANADEISYDGSKGLYILRALGNQNATISQDSPKGPRREIPGRRIDFIPALKWIAADRVAGAAGS